ncbi:hypothetical protein FRB94_000626 [Tulasnella sp. JGI-2019a]|nr:hypothetical protein FRB93_010414 [Tulasnella sp. JGI-2019a]KAG9006532.1 hypothetical protein FRB94_000626 [Tulasnella sp. JGI-2019a]KAG9032888.1 hypothetical protein FRB95_000903 [Tulasnella sp. JGI-2019a]
MARRLFDALFDRVVGDTAIKKKWFSPPIAGTHKSLIRDNGSPALRIDQGPPPSDPQLKGLKPAFVQVGSKVKDDAEKKLKETFGTHGILAQFYIDPSIKDPVEQEKHMEDNREAAYTDFLVRETNKASGSKKK